jgi:predicted oxidoreductase
LGGVAYDAWGNTFDVITQERIKKELVYQAKKYNTDATVIALAWLLLHPSNISPIVGTTNKLRINQSITALDINYQPEDWYRLLEARNGYRVP